LPATFLANNAAPWRCVNRP